MTPGNSIRRVAVLTNSAWLIRTELHFRALRFLLPRDLDL